MEPARSYISQSHPLGAKRNFLVVRRSERQNENPPRPLQIRGDWEYIVAIGAARSRQRQQNTTTGSPLSAPSPMRPAARPHT